MKVNNIVLMGNLNDGVGGWEIQVDESHSTAPAKSTVIFLKVSPEYSAQLGHYAAAGGKRVLVEGALANDSAPSKDGAIKRWHIVDVKKVEFIDNK